MPTINDILATGDDNAVAISGPDRDDLTFAGLRAHVNNTVLRLNMLASDATTVLRSSCRTDRRWPPHSSQSLRAPQPHR